MSAVDGIPLKKTRQTAAWIGRTIDPAAPGKSRSWRYLRRLDYPTGAERNMARTRSEAHRENARIR